MAILILPHAENHLVVIRLEARGEGEIRAAGDGLEFTRRNAQRDAVAVDAVTVAPIFRRQHLAALVQERNPPLGGDFRGDFAVRQRPFRAGLVVLRPLIALVPRVSRVDDFAADDDVRRFNRFGQRPVVVVHARLGAHAHAQTVLAPRVNPAFASAIVDDEPVILLLYAHENASLSRYEGENQHFAASSSPRLTSQSFWERST